MSKDAHIDKIFKDGLGQRDFSNGDAMWQKMEDVLDTDAKKKKRRVAFMILFACLLITGFFIAKNFNTHTNNNLAETKAIATVTTNSAVVKKNKIVSSGRMIAAANTVKADAGETIASVNTTKTATSKRVSEKRFFVNDGSKKFTVLNAVADEAAVTAAEQEIPDNILAGKITVEPDFVSLQYSKRVSVITAPAVQKSAMNTVVAGLKNVPVKTKKISIEAIAGIDALRMNREAGYYAGIRINRLLDKGTVISFGLNYASNTVNDRYRLSAKPTALRGETDGKINDIRTIRLPIYFQRQLANSKFALMAGLVPTYVINAAVYNVPNSFNGNPEQYRKFELKDINRFNILFGAGIKYSPLKRISFELSGSYGFTSLVKDSYINQSRVNDNFKSIQAGIVLMLK